MVEPLICNQVVVGSSPAASIRAIAHRLERLAYNQLVVGSIPTCPIFKDGWLGLSPRSDV